MAGENVKRKEQSCKTQLFFETHGRQNGDSFAKHRRKVLTPLEKLHKRIEKDIVTKKYFGDIIIDDSEYEIIKTEFKAKYHLIINSYSHKLTDLIVAIALVQIGIRFYDGKYWIHVAQELEIDNLPVNQQTWLGNVFVDTLAKYQKISLPHHEKVNNILMHGFVSNCFANSFFDFLFEYYRKDLERDIDNNDRDNMNTLIEAMIRNDNTNRTYLIVRQTADAIHNNRRGASIRIRRLLKLIDKCFWDRNAIINGRNRLTALFNQWRNESEIFEYECSIRESNNACRKGKKSFSAPYLKCDFETAEVSLILPSQLVKLPTESSEIDLYWQIKLGDDEITLPQKNYYAVITGYKTDTVVYPLNSIQVLQDISVELYNDKKKLRIFKDISADCVRFFDLDGDLLKAEALPDGSVYGYSFNGVDMQSKAVMYKEEFAEITLTVFEFEIGDILVLPDGNILSIGKKVAEGILQRSVVKEAYSLYGDRRIPIYLEAPSIIIQILPSRVSGTLIRINENSFRMSEISCFEIPIDDRSGEKAYLVDTNQFGCANSGHYSVTVDVPNDRTDRRWSFCVIPNLEYQFEDGPYVFKSKGTITFGEQISVVPQSYMEKNEGEHSFNFNIIPNNTHLHFATETANGSVDIFIEIQVLHWKFDNADWEIEKPNELWHSHFPTIISFQYPTDAIELSMNEELDSENEEPHSVKFKRNKTTGSFDCDVTRFKSWLVKEHSPETLFIKMDGKRIPFVDIVSKSQIISCLITGDFANNMLCGSFNIIGHANYFVDITVNGEKLLEKLLIVDGKISASVRLEGGICTVVIFEMENDDSGFDEPAFTYLGEYSRELINPYNLTGKTIEIRHIIKGLQKQFRLPLSCRYYVNDLSFAGNNAQFYWGKLIAENKYGNVLTCIPVVVDFFDKSKLETAFIEFLDETDPTTFLYDNQRKIIVKNEQPGLPRALRYRRYEDIYRDDYYFAVEFISQIQKKL